MWKTKHNLLLSSLPSLINQVHIPDKHLLSGLREVLFSKSPQVSGRSASRWSTLTMKTREPPCFLVIGEKQQRVKKTVKVAESIPGLYLQFGGYRVPHAYNRYYNYLTFHLRQALVGSSNQNYSRHLATCQVLKSSWKNVYNTIDRWQIRGSR